MVHPLEGAQTFTMTHKPWKMIYYCIKTCLLKSLPVASCTRLVCCGETVASDRDQFLQRGQWRLPSDKDVAEQRRCILRW